jgi:hypothetical protein
MDKKREVVPKDIVRELDATVRKEKEPYEVIPTIEKHQVKIPLPKKIRLLLGLKKGAKCKLIFDEEKRELLCKF